MPQPGSPTSLIKPDATPGDDMRIIANYDVSVAGDMDAPTDPAAMTDKLEGWNTRGARWLHYMVELLDVAATASGVDFQLWLFDGNVRRWYLDTRLGTSGTVTIANTDAGYPKKAGIIEIAGAERAYLRLLNDTGTWSGDADKGANAWLAGVNER